jgi:hypothetical protein
MAKLYFKTISTIKQDLTGGECEKGTALLLMVR